MKYIVLVPDGVADEPLEELGGKTPLEAASTPNMNFIAQTGLSGMVKIIPDGLAPGSDVGNMSVLGYDATKGFSGRAPLEAANLGIELKDDELAFRCNLVTVENETMIDYSAGHITVDEAAQIMETVAEELSDDKVKFYTGKSYRHVAVVKTNKAQEFMQTKCMPPHDIMDQKVVQYLPNGPMQEFLLSYMERSRPILADHPVNKARQAAGQRLATMTWLWGQGGRPNLELFQERYGVTGSIISAVDLVNGIGRVIGLDVISVPGATGYYDTNYKGKAEYGVRSLDTKDFIYIHVESTDEAGHNGDAKAKMQCIEDFDKCVVGTVLHFCKHGPEARVLVTPDHPTPVAKRTHTRAPVPFAMCGAGIENNGGAGYNERFAGTTGFSFASGVEMMKHFMSK